MAVYIGTESAGAACAAITAYLPSGHGITSWTNIIAEATAMVDSRLAPRYWTFPDVAGTPATPELIKRIAARLGAWIALTQLQPANRFADVSAFRHLRDDAIADLEFLMRDDVLEAIPPTAISNEDIVVPGASPLETSEHKFACAPRDVIPGSVIVTNQAGTTTYKQGIDYDTYWRQEVRGWVLFRANSAIVNSDHVSYEYSHLKRRDLDYPPRFSGGTVVRA